MPITLADETIIETRPDWTLAVNRNQNLLGKVIIVARRDLSAVEDLSDVEWASLKQEIARVRAALDALFHPDQINYAFLMNQDAQVHLHVVPRYRDGREWQGQSFDDAHFGEVFGTEQHVLAGADLAALAGAIRAALL